MNDDLDDSIRPGCGCRDGIASLVMAGGALGFLAAFIVLTRRAYPALIADYPGTLVALFLGGLLAYGLVTELSIQRIGRAGEAQGKLVVEGLQGDGRSCLKAVIGGLVVVAAVVVLVAA